MIVKQARLWSIAIVIALPILMNAPVLANVLKGDFMLLYGGFASHVQAGPLPGYPLIDPSIGYDQQPNGFRVAYELLHGRIAWWNPYEGVGFPIGESIGNAAFFPFSILLALPRGQALDATAVEIAAGIGMLMLVRRLGLGWLPAVAAAGLYELSGTFAWIGGDVGNTMPFLAWLIYGIEGVRLAARRGEPFGWGWIAGALALSLYAGFPESAYLNGLLALAWAVVRFVQLPLEERGLYARGLFAGGVVGMLLAVPILQAFYEELQVSFAGAHLGGSFANVVLSAGGVPMLLLPYMWGAIFVNGPVSDLWSNVGGFLGTGIVVLAAAALFGRTDRALRWVLAGWTLFGVCAAFGAPLLHSAFVHIPLVNLTAYYRYLPPSWSFALAVLAAYALRDALGAERAELAKRYSVAVVAVLALLGAALVHNRALVHTMHGMAGDWLVGSLGFGLAVLLAIAVAVQLPGARARTLVLAATALVEAAAYFAIPMLSYPRDGKLELGGIAFLQRNLGLQRYYALGPIMPNYGSYFAIASINHNDLPVPNEWLRFIHERLDPYADPINFTGTIPVPGPGVSSRPAELRSHLAGYEAAGVAYVVAPPDDNPFAPSYDSAPGKGAGRATNVARGTSAVATLLGPMPAGRARGVSVFQGNYAKHAGGRLEVRVCNARRACASGSRALSESTDNQYFHVPLDKPVSLAPQPVTVSFTTSSPDRPEALWTFPGSPDQMVAVNGVPQPNAAFRLRFLYALTGPLPPAVYHDAAMTIYRLPHPRPYAEAPGCTLAVRSRTEMEADCPRGAELRRLELFYPGWSARVNGRAAEIGEFDRAFQRLALPAGKSAIVFSFAPPGIGYGLAAFGAGALAVLALALNAFRRSRLPAPVPAPVLRGGISR